MAKSSGGIGGSGIFGGVGIGSIVQCKAEDTSPFCQFAKLMNIISWLLFLFVIFWLAKTYLMKK